MRPLAWLGALVLAWPQAGRAEETATAPAAASAPAAAPPGAAPPSIATSGWIAVAPSTGASVSPGVLSAVTDALRRSAAGLGYGVVPDERATQALSRLARTSVDSPADLWRFMHAAQASLALVARVEPAAGYFFVRVQLANADGSGPFEESASASPDNLARVVEGLVPRLLPPASSHAAAAAAPAALAAGVAPPVPYPSPPTPPAGQAPLPNAPVAPARMAEPEHGLVRLTAQTETALGVYEGFFYTQLVGGRIDLRLKRRLSLGAYGAYANLKGRAGRVNSALVSGMLDYRFDLGSHDVVQLMTRGSVGYLVYNGAVLRAAGGFAFAVGEHQIAVDLVAPTLWMVKNRPALSFDLALEVGFQL